MRTSRSFPSCDIFRRNTGSTPGVWRRHYRIGRGDVPKLPMAGAFASWRWSTTTPANVWRCSGHLDLGHSGGARASPDHRGPGPTQDNHLRQRHRADLDRDPGLGRTGNGSAGITSHRASRSRTPSSKPSMAGARRVVERDPVPLAAACPCAP